MAVGRPLGSMVVSLGLDSVKFTDGLKSIQNQFRLAKSEMRANVAELASTGTAYEKASAKVEGLTKIMDVNKRKIESLRETYQKQVEMHGEYSTSAMRTASKINDAIRVQENYRRQLNDAKVAMNEAKRGTDSLRVSLETLQKTTTASITGLQAQGKTNEANLVKYRSLKEEIQQYNRILDDEKAKLKELVNVKGADARETQEQKVKVAELNAKIQQSQAEYDKLNKTYKNVSTSSAILRDHMDKLKQSIQSIGRNMTQYITVPVVGAFTMSAKSAMDFEYQLQDIRKEVEAQSGSLKETDKIMKEMSSDVLKWSKQYGVGTKEINEGLFSLISNGYSARVALGMMPELLKTMTANGDKAGKTIELTSSLMEQFGLNTGSTNSQIRSGNSLMNQMTEITHKTALNLDDLGTISANAGAALHGMHINTADFLTVAGKLRSAGIDASSVGTGLSSMLTRIATGTGAAAADLKKYNIAVYDSHHNMRSMLDIVGDMKKAYSGMNDEERQKFLYDVMGQENMKVGSTLMNAHISDYRKLSKEVSNSNGVVDKYNKTMRSTSEFSVQEFKSSLNSLSISLGQKLLPTLTPVIKGLTSMVNRFAKLPSPVKNSILVLTGLAAILGPMAIGIAALITSVGKIRTVMNGLNIAKKIKDIANSFKLLTILNPTTLGIGAVIALGAAFVLAYQKIKPFREFINGIGKGIMNSLRPVINMVGTIGNSFKKLFNAMKTYFSENGLSFLQAFANVFKVVAIAIGASMSRIIVIIKVALNLIKNIFSTTWGSIEQIVGGVFTAIGGLLKVFAGLFTGNWQLLWSGVKDIFSGIWNTFKGIVGGVINVIIGIVNSGIDGINWLLDKFGAKQVKKLSPVKWATGTTRYYPNGLTETQLAMVNDGGKREAIVYPNGQVGMFKGMNVTTILPKGSHVINGDDTERLGLDNYPDMHYYAKGTISFGSIWDGIKSGASKLWDDVSDGVKLAKNIVSHPIEALESAFSSSLKIGKSVQFAIDTAKGLGSFIIKNIKNGIVKEIKKWIDSNEDEGDSNSTSPKPTGSHKHWMEQAGIPKSWYEDLNWIINHESGWRVNATNPSSGAYGLGQALPGNKMASAGKDWKTNAITQLKWVKSYIKGRYGNAANAKRFWQAHNWYANGGFVTQEQIAHIAEGNRPEAIIPLTNRTRAMQILAQVRDKYGLSAGNVVLNGGKQDNTDLSSLERKFDTVISLLGQIAGLSAEQVNALKAMKPSQNFDKNKFYQDMFRDQTISNYMNM
ncbi:phage tail tape measure protein [Ligilactobacillus salivarius]|uniref:Phage tail tape measure protein n=1 Tax=Ligilactobacillus salivarius TaxID=1624 RepID=A0A1V9U1J6_9LACO|nr:phage tail tape measure protein [Ligilactobacillus salivarius]OQR21448.1 phage tail tape measure protein [Ligilactobacillus salivarius]OQR23544.1 phage tail tape measure protein [Ligilactobacillus salivarius]OQR25516.1 phage tail tape measure protein [Ligilactobacillus salivarius]